ncbi:MAG TPA: prolyl oligopeptidase family serine peptidase, partial [Draconibacterium sp.]|nr:prolyl oligopeptidase family serine peptidase [Draconibacterium sp.]
GEIKKVKSLPSFFPTEKYQVQQFEAISKDATKIPYFVVSSKEIKYTGNNPTLLYAYGGFEIPMLPGYNSVTGTAWLENGGVYVLANIRGGGEFGPSWHQAGLKENRQRVYDDFYAVSEKLIEQKITKREKLGIFGGSNGGLLVGVAYTQRPDLYGAVVCAVPLLDMKRYNKLLAGASWMAEYGNPDIPEEWEYISKYSPYQNIKPGMKYPEVFFTTSTRDDRVHPGHARKAVAKMDELGYKVYYFENTEGGHAGASTNEQRAQMNALIYAYLQLKLMD